MNKTVFARLIGLLLVSFFFFILLSNFDIIQSMSWKMYFEVDDEKCVRRSLWFFFYSSFDFSLAFVSNRNWVIWLRKNFSSSVFFFACFAEWFKMVWKKKCSLLSQSRSFSLSLLSLSPSVCSSKRFCARWFSFFFFFVFVCLYLRDVDKNLAA